MLILAASIIFPMLTSFSGIPFLRILVNIIELIILAIIMSAIAYINVRFFPWAKVNLNPHKNMSLSEDMKNVAREEYQDTLNEGPQ